MKLKTVTLLGMIASILSACISLLYLLGEWEFMTGISFLANLVSIFSGASLALFFYTLYKNQK